MSLSRTRNNTKLGGNLLVSTDILRRFPFIRMLYSII